MRDTVTTTMNSFVSVNSGKTSPSAKEKAPQHLDRVIHFSRTPDGNHLFRGRSCPEFSAIQKFLTANRVSKCSLLLLRLNQFHLLEETYGFHVGENLVSDCKDRVLSQLKERDVLAQVAEDEFLVLLNADLDRPTVSKIAERLIKHCTYVQIHGEEHIPVKLDIGISRFPDHSHLPEELLRCARIALHDVDPMGPGIYKFYSERALAQTKHKVSMTR